MLTLTVKDLFSSFQIFSQLAAHKLNAGHQRLAYNLGRTLRELRKEAETLSEQQQVIYKAFPHKETTQPDGSKILLAEFEKFTTEEKSQFDVEIKSLDTTQIEVWGHKLTLDEIEKANITISGNDFAALHWLIADEDETQVERTTTATA